MLVADNSQLSPSLEGQSSLIQVCATLMEAPLPQVCQNVDGIEIPALVLKIGQFWRDFRSPELPVE